MPTGKRGTGSEGGDTMPAAHVEFYGGPRDGDQTIHPEVIHDFRFTSDDGKTHLYRLKCVLGNVPVKLPGGRYAMNYAGVVEEKETER